MAYAIIVRYAGPTNYRGSRWIATGPALHYLGRPVRCTVPYDYAARDGGARDAAQAVIDRLRDQGWRVALDGAGYTHPADPDTNIYGVRHYSD